MFIEKINLFSLNFFSLVLEAMPFILIGSIISSIIEAYISKDKIRRFMPKNGLLGVLIFPLIAIIFPICECAMIVVMRRLLKKNIPIHIAITYMLSGPILNIVVFSSTYFAFGKSIDIALMRTGVGYITAIFIGFFVYFYEQDDNILKNNMITEHSHHKSDQISKFKIILNTIFHDLFYVGKFLILGAFISALVNSLVSTDILTSIGSNGLAGSLTMIILAFILSICSESDAFIAASYNTFDITAKLSFLTFGPLIDAKLIIVYLNMFKMKFLIIFVSLIFILTIILPKIFIYLF